MTREQRLRELVDRLRALAAEIRAEDIKGWGNTADFTADELEAILNEESEGGKSNTPVLDSIVYEIHRRAGKEWAGDGCDFTVTIESNQYKALCEEEGSPNWPADGSEKS